MPRHLTTDDQGDWQFEGSITLGASSILSPATLSSDEDDYDPTGFRTSGVVQVAILRLTSTSNVDITGLAAPSPAVAAVVTIVNAGNKKIKLKEGDGDSVAANRFLLKSDVDIEADGSYALFYDTVDSRWRAYNDQQ